jgi:uncharacterized protein YndB with AHSA1/START domain
MLTVVRQAKIPAPASRAWRCLTEPPLLAGWFADAPRFEPGAPFRLSFGDGDFFEGDVREWREPSRLVIGWKFMGLGPPYEITYALDPVSESETNVTVRDRGALTAEEAEGLSEGWDDFLSRLERFARTGQPARYEWSQTFGLGAILDGSHGPALPPELGEPEWWAAVFDGSEVEAAERAGQSLLVRFGEPAWEGARTEARLQTHRSDLGTYLSLTHEGWTGLPEALQIPARRRYAGLWREAFAGLEAKYRTSGAGAAGPAVTAA